jgi:hypothetical protein
MPPLSIRSLQRCLTQKLEAQETQRKHRRFEIYDDNGALVAVTVLSHSWRPSTALHDRMVSLIKEELNLQRTSELFDLVDCTLTRDEYLRIARRS